MKKLFYFYLMIFGLIGYGQTPTNMKNNFSPDGLMDNLFDHYGNKYSLADMKIEPVKYYKNGATSIAVATTAGIPAGYFNLFFETGSGMENSSDPIQLARQNVLVQVFKDISNFINSPLTNPGNTAKVNIWVRKISNIPNVPSNVAGLASSFYSMPNNTTTSFGGIIDGEIWKTIHLGKDSYENVVSLLALNAPNSNASGAFYHGIVAFNFNTITWNTSLTATNITGLQDLYTVALHEITHALGFTSLINSSGGSKLGVGFNYFTRYDTKLKNFSNSAFLLTNIGACNSMYNYSFNNTLNTAILQPTATPYCNNVVKYVGTSVVPVYTPSTFSDGSSLGHFEPQCVSPIPNFVMDMITPPGVIRRYLTSEEETL